MSLGTFAILILPWIDTTKYNDNAVFVAMKVDSYYHLLVPLTIPVTIIMVRIYVFYIYIYLYMYINKCLLCIEGHIVFSLTGSNSIRVCVPFMQVTLNWFSMKLFKHNS
jgi:hypothetical protein